MNRSQRILTWLGEHPRGGTLSQIMAAVASDAPAPIVGSTLGNLVLRGKVVRTGKRMRFVYSLAPDGLLDRRCVPLRERARLAAQRKVPGPSPAAAARKVFVDQVLAQYSLLELQLVAWLRKQRGPRRLDEILEGIGPACTHEAMGAALDHLHASGQLAREGAGPQFTFAIPGRAKPAITRTKPAKPAAKPRPVAKAPARVPRSTPSTKPAAAPKPRTTLDSTIARLPSKNGPGGLDSGRLAADVAAFLAAGGAIEHVPIGKATKSQLRFEHDNSTLARARAAIAHRLA